MKINLNNGIQFAFIDREASKVNTDSLNKVTNELLSEDEITIKGESIFLEEMFTLAKGKDIVRYEKIDEIKSLIEKDEYHVTGEDIITKLLRG